jgi:hypothetical protein
MKNELLLLVCIILMSVSACSPPSPAAPAESTQAPALSPEPTVTEPVPPEGQAFTSERFGYSFVYPAGWIIKDRPGEWPAFDPLDPNRTGGIDAFAGYIDNRNLTIGIGARALTDGETLEAWVATAKSLILAGVSKGVCYEGSENDPVSDYECPSSHDSFGLVALSIHNNQGYWITWISPQGNAEADEAEFTQILSTFSFVD